jgi:hypothetical protein
MTLGEDLWIRKKEDVVYVGFGTEYVIALHSAAPISRLCLSNTEETLLRISVTRQS